MPVLHSGLGRKSVPSVSCSDSSPQIPMLLTEASCTPHPLMKLLSAASWSSLHLKPLQIHLLPSRLTRK